MRHEIRHTDVSGLSGKKKTLHFIPDVQRKRPFAVKTKKNKKPELDEITFKRLLKETLY